MLLNTALLVCCCLLPIFILTAMESGENLTSPEPYSKNQIGGSRAEIDTRLPWYTSGFE